MTPAGEGPVPLFWTTALKSMLLLTPGLVGAHEIDVTTRSGWLGGGVNVMVGVNVGVFVAPPEYQTRTGIQSREKSREVLLETLTIRTRRLALVSSLVFHVRLQVSVELPKMSVRSLVDRLGPVFMDVQEVPLSHESCTQK